MLSLEDNEIGCVDFSYELGKTGRQFTYKKSFRLKLPSTREEMSLRELEIIVRKNYFHFNFCVFLFCFMFPTFFPTFFFCIRQKPPTLILESDK